MPVVVSGVFKKILLVAGIVIITATPCLAQSETNLWQKAEIQNAKLAYFFAGRVQTRTDTYDGKGKLIGGAQSVSVFKGLEGTLPVRVRQSHSTSPGLKLDVPDMGIEDVMDHPETGLARADRYTLAGKEIVAGVECQVFNFEGIIGGKGGDHPHFKGRAWIESTSARPVKVDYTVDVSDAPSAIKSLKYSVMYDKKSMPAKVVIEITISMLFHKFRFVRQKELSDWVERSDAEKTGSTRT